MALLILWVLQFDLWAACPKPLPQEVYSTRCTGKTIFFQNEGKSQKLKDCELGQSPKLTMNPQITTLIEKLRCLYGDKIVITSAYRNKKHNLYSWAYVYKKTGNKRVVSKTSKHQLGRAIDFYIKDFNFQKHKNVVPQLHKWAGFFSKKIRGSKNKIWVKVYQANEGRDPDNLHSSPYIHIELRDK